MRALITGGAGFIGSHVVDRFLAEGWTVTVVDNFDDFYDPAIKRRNLAHHFADPDFRLVQVDIRDATRLHAAASDRYDVIVHLAARPGVRASMNQPGLYFDVNVRGTLNVLRLARKCGVRQFLFASSSSVYGDGPALPWREDTSDPAPISPYAFTKLTAEMLGRDFSLRHSIRFIALRLFTVYGPRQRPDLAIHKFAASMLRGNPITVYGDGMSSRDYTYVEDIVDGIWAAKDYRGASFDILNLGRGTDISIYEVVGSLQMALGTDTQILWEREQQGDLRRTLADCSKVRRLIGCTSRVSFSEGLVEFVDWLTHEEGRSRVVARVL